MKIFITGCAKSGTTLLLRLFHAFKDVEIIWKPGELGLEYFCELSQSKPVLAAKRNGHNIFSVWWDHIHGKIERAHPERHPPIREFLRPHLKLIKDHDIKILNIIRDGRDVIVSDDRWVEPRRWISCMEQRRWYPKMLTCEVRYEDLVCFPGREQERIADTFELDSAHKFSAYPDFVPPVAFERLEGQKIYRPRKIGPDSIGKGRDIWKTIIKDPEILKKFELELRRAGYV